MKTRFLGLFCGMALSALATSAQSGAGILSIFEPKTVAPITITSGDLRTLRALPGLEAFGTLSTTRTSPVVRLRQAYAGTLAHHALMRPAHLPATVGSSPRTQIFGRMEMTFTLDAARVRRWTSEHHRVLAPMPRSLNGSKLLISVGPLAVTAYVNASARTRHGESELPRGLLIAQAVAPQVRSNGASVNEIENYLLVQPGIPPRLAAQIRALGDPNAALPIPVIIDRNAATKVSVQGVQGLLVGDNTGVGSALIWRRAGFVYAVAGQLTQDEVLAIANSLH